MTESLVIGYVHPAEVSALFCESLTGTLLEDALRHEGSRIIERGAVCSVASGPRIASARNDVVRAFLKTRAEWLLMVDADMVFTLAQIDGLFEVAHPSRAPVVGGLCFGGGRSGLVYPTLYRLVKGDDPVQIIEDYPEGLCEVDATGAAFLLMHRTVLKNMGEKYGEPAPWFVEGSVYKGFSFGEDWAFCMRLKDMGVPLYVRTDTKIGHVKPQVLNEDAYALYRAKRELVGDEGIVAEFTEQFHAPTTRRLEVVR